MPLLSRSDGTVLVWIWMSAWVGAVGPALAQPTDTATARPPASWGGDHVGQPFPPYITGDECLFCHRDTGAIWPENRHQKTVRLATPDNPALLRLRQHPGGEQLARQTDYLLGENRAVRFLRKSAAYGKLDLLSTQFVPASGAAAAATAGTLQSANASPKWDSHAFGDRCAGGHATAVDSPTRAFSAVSLDCVTCHGVVDLDHSKNTERVLLSGKNREPRQVVSLCGQCHLRGGTSRSTGLPYPNTFVAGDNLFRDFAVDFSDEAIRSRPPRERHLWLNTRDVVVRELRETTCLDCHDVHPSSTKKHSSLPATAICSSCHLDENSSRLREEWAAGGRTRAQSNVCEY